MSYLLCIDVGTSVCKSVIYDLEFNEVSRAHQDITTFHPKPRWAEQKPAEWWNATVNTTKKALSNKNINPKDILGVAVCGQGHGPVLLDNDGKVLFPCLVWPDLRAIKQAELITAYLGKEAQAYYTAAKLLWIKENHEKVFNEMYKFVLPKDYVRFKFTDRILTEIGDAKGTMMYSSNEDSWDYQLIDFIGIPHEKLPEICPSDQIIGEVANHASVETGLEKGTKVIAGKPDYYCTQIGLGDYLKSGRAVVYLGSAPSIFTFTKEGQYKGDFMGVGGASLKWLREQLCSVDSSTVTLEDLDGEAEKIEPGSGGLLFFPHLMGERSPARNPYARGVMFGLSLGHTRGHITRAMMEGITFQLKLIAKSILSSEEIDEILVIGGGAKSTVWRQIIADIFNVPVCLPDRDEVATLGLAILLSTGLKICKDISEAQKKAKLKIVERREPRREYQKKYDKMFDLYSRLEEQLLSKFFNARFENRFLK